MYVYFNNLVNKLIGLENLNHENLKIYYKINKVLSVNIRRICTLSVKCVE